MGRTKLDAPEMEAELIEDEDIAWGDEAETDDGEDNEPTVEQIIASGPELADAAERSRRVREELELPEAEQPQPASNPDELTDTERSELGRHERTIARGLDTFVSVGNALLAIRRDRLYRETHKTFEVYCEQRWRMTRDYAGKLIGAAEVVGNLNTIVSVLPANEAQARPLTKLEPDEQREAWKEAVETASDGKVTAKHVEQVVEYRRQPKPTPKPDLAPPNYYTPEPGPRERVEMTLRCPTGEIVASTSDDELHAEQANLLDAIVETLAPPQPTEPEVSPVQVEQSNPVMPEDLAQAGFTFVRAGAGMWAVEFDDAREGYVSNWFFNPLDAVEDAREYLATLTPQSPAAPKPDPIVMVGFRLGLLDKLLRCVHRSSLLFLTPAENDELKALLETSTSGELAVS